MPRLVPRFAAAVAALAAATGCSSSPTTSTAPTQPAVQLTETFSQTLSPNGAVIFPFNATAAGAVNASLSTVSPDSGLTLAIDLGTWSGTSCTTVVTTNPATQGAVVSATATAAGSLCVQVRDAHGQIASSEAIIVTVTHF
jgi:hypothetical protein